MNINKDDEIVEMLKSSERKLRNKGLEVLYHQHYEMVKRYIINNNGKITDAEDIFQDGLIAMYEQINKGVFKGQSKLKTYLFSICKNLWFKKLRKASSKSEVFGQEVEIVDGGNIMIDTIIINEELAALRKLIGKLGQDCQKVLKLYYYERKRMKEIASLMNFGSEQVAKNKKNRCLTKLRSIAQTSPDLKSFIRNKD